MKKLMILMICFLSIVSCKNSDAEKVNETFTKFAEAYKKSHDFREVPKDLLSKNLLYFFNRAQTEEANSAEAIQKSEFPTDKPDMIEGDVFSSVYDGFNEYKILKTDLKTDTATLKLELKNTESQPALSWKDDCIMVKENGSWKIDNFIYGQPSASGAKSTQEVFTAKHGSLPVE